MGFVGFSILPLKFGGWSLGLRIGALGLRVWAAARTLAAVRFPLAAQKILFMLARFSHISSMVVPYLFARIP